MVVAMDGPAGCGKSTVAKLLSKNLGFLYINSGNLYRALAYALIESKIPVAEAEAAITCARTQNIDCDSEGGILRDGVPLGQKLRSPEVDAVVAQLSAIPEIRNIVNTLIRKVSKNRNSVVEGRDMTTVVFPNAEVKFYIDASIEERARRRYRQEGTTSSYEEVLKNIRMRDEIDKGKSVGALKIATDALYLDTSDLTIEQVYEKVYSKILHLREAHGE